MILVVGATGHLGSEIIRRLRAKGKEVRGLVRTTSAPEKVERLKAMGVETVVGNLRDRASLDAATKGVRAVISTATIIGTAQAGDSFEETDGAGTISLIDAAKAAGVEHFVFISFDGSRFPATPLTAAKQAAERHLKSSGIDYTILHPSVFMEVWLGPMIFGDPASGQVRVFGSGNDKIPYVSLSDVAEVAVRAIGAPSARNATIPVGGPENVSQREVVGLFEGALGSRLEVNEIPEQALQAQFASAQNPFEKTIAGLMLALAQVDQTLTPLEEPFKFKMATVRDYVSKTARPLEGAPT